MSRRTSRRPSRDDTTREAWCACGHHFAGYDRQIADAAFAHWKRCTAPWRLFPEPPMPITDHLTLGAAS